MIRTYQQHDAQAIIQTWNDSLPCDGINEKTFINHVLTDDNFDPEGLFIVEHEGRIIGALLALIRRTAIAGGDLEPDSGWITSFFVHHDYRRRGYGHALIQAAEEYFIRHHRTTIYFASYAPHYFVPGIDRIQYPDAASLLESVGFHPLYQAVAMDKNLVGFSVPSDIQSLEVLRRAEGYFIEPLTLAYIADTIAFIAREFDPDWARALREALRGGIPLPQILIARHHQDIVGFCMYGGYDNVSERFGTVGVARALRGTGLGKVLLYRSLEHMRHSGLHNAWFLWTGEKEPAGHLYLRAGFTVTRRFDVMKKPLTIEGCI